jgi:thiol:disulfide interchange protein/DsbC/DsbD-like thiol-disulfide interchange protein
MTTLRIYAMLCTLFLFWLLTSLPASALTTSASVTTSQSTATLVADRESITAGEPFWIALKLELQPNWHSYWKNAGDSGLPTSLTLTLPEGFTQGDMQWPTPERFIASGIVNYGYSGEAWHFVEITPSIPAATPAVIHARAQWLVCKDICIPETADLTLSLPVRGAPAATDSSFHQRLAEVPLPTEVQARFARTDKAGYVFIADPALNEQLQFYPVQNNVVSNETLPTLTRLTDGVLLRFAVGDTPLPATLQAVVRSGAGGAYAIIAEHDESLLQQQALIEQVEASVLPASGAAAESTGDMGILLAILLAFAGGVVLNLMPCVLPILSLKALSLVRLSEHSRVHAHVHGLAYTVGVVLSFVSFALILIIVKQTGAEIGWGFQLQSPAFVAGLTLVMFVVALNLSGVFEVPNLVGAAGQSLTSKPTALGSFATGVLAVLVATPCTAPFMAPAIGFALTQPPLMLVAIFAALGFGLAAPFLIISAFPSARRWLPKSGAWMVRFKQFLAFPMYATAAWLAWVLTRQVGTDALAVLLAAAVVIALCVWSANVTRSRFKQWLMVGCVACIFALTLPIMTRLNAPALVSNTAVPYSDAHLQKLRAAGTPVFLFATADWCITCKVNERLVLNTEPMLVHFRERGITVMEADWTRYDPAITSLLASHGRAGVPMYVYYPAGGGQPVLLPQVLTLDTVKEMTEQ